MKYPDIWIVEVCPHWEGCELKGIFVSKEDAQAAVDNLDSWLPDEIFISHYVFDENQYVLSEIPEILEIENVG